MTGMHLRKDLVSIIIVTRNSEITLAPCLASIRSQTYTNYEIILVDNGSTDNTLTLVNPQTVRLITNPCNLGFAKANNIGIEHSTGKYFLLLNSTSDSVRRRSNVRLQPHMQNRLIAAAGLKLSH